MIENEGEWLGRIAFVGYCPNSGLDLDLAWAEMSRREWERWALAAAAVAAEVRQQERAKIAALAARAEKSLPPRYPFTDAELVRVWYLNGIGAALAALEKDR